MTVVRGFGPGAEKWSWESSRWEVLAAGRAWATGQRRLVRAVTALDASGEWALDGARTCAHWVADALDVEVCTAREWLRVGHALKGLETIDRAFSEGRLSYTKVRALTRLATPENQAELCELAERVAAARLAPALARWLSRRETPEQTERRQHDAEGRPINASSRRRHPTARQRRVIRERDRACVDCGTTENLVYDHDPEFSKTGHTLVEETRLRCGTCHRLRHEKLKGAA